MAPLLDEHEIQSINEHLDNIYAPANSETLAEAVMQLKNMLETQDLDQEDQDQDEETSNDQDESKAKIEEMKKHILVSKPDFFEYLLKFPKETDDDFEPDTIINKSELVTEMLRNSSSSKSAIEPFVEQLLFSSFQEDKDEIKGYSEWAYMARDPIAILLRPDPGAQTTNETVVNAISDRVKSFPEILSPELKASEMTDELVKKQKALTQGFVNIVLGSLKPDAVPSFIRTGALDALLTVLGRGPLPPLETGESRNDGLENACEVLNRLMETSSKELADALVERQAIPSLVKHMTYVCGLEDVYSATSALRALVALAKHNEELLKQVVAEAEKIFLSDPGELGPGAPVVLWAILNSATDNDIENDVSKILRSKKYVPFFLSAIKPGASDGILEAIAEALAARIDQQPRDQLQKGVSSPQDVEKIIFLLEWASAQSAPDISATARVVHELVLPSSDEDTGGWYSPAEELGRLNKKFCLALGEAFKARCDAALALAPKDLEEGALVTEPSEAGLAHMKNVKIIAMLENEQYTLLALLANGLLEYLQALVIENPSALSRRAGLELLAYLTHDSSLSEDFAFVPDIIEGFQGIVAYTLENDSRPLIRALAMQWLNRIMRYRHPKNDAATRYAPAVKFVTEHVSEEKLVQMLKGTEDEAKVAAEMIESMVKYWNGPEVRERFRANKELLAGLWNGLFWDPETAPQSQDEDISEDAFLYGNIDTSSGGALSQLLDPIADADIIAQHLTPRISELKDKDWDDFYSGIESMPDIGSLAILQPELGVLARITGMIPHVEQVPFAMQLLRKLSQGSILARVHLAQDPSLYPALVQALKDEEEAIQTLVLMDLESLLYGSNVSKARFVKEGGIKPLLDIVLSEDEALSKFASSTLLALVSDFPEGARAAFDAGAVPVLRSKHNENERFNRAGLALESINEFKDVPLIDRIEFTPEAYAKVGKQLSDPAVLERLTKNLESSLDEKQLGIMGGLAPALAECLSSDRSDPKAVLRALKALLVIDGQGWQGFAVIQTIGQKSGLVEVLKPFVESEDEDVQQLAIAIKEAIVGEEAKEENEEGEKEEEEEEENPGSEA